MVGVFLKVFGLIARKKKKFSVKYLAKMPKSSCFQVEIRKSVFATFRKNFLREKKGEANLI
jgi:hypothetical protein